MDRNISTRDLIDHWNQYMRLRSAVRGGRRLSSLDQRKLLHYQYLHGSGLFDSIKEFFSYRKGFSPADEKVFQKYKDHNIAYLQVVRTPLSTTSQAFADIASLGTFSSQAKKLGYDRVYHLYMLIYFDGVKEPLHYEKNETVRLRVGAPATNVFTQAREVPLHHMHLTLEHFIRTAQKFMTADEYWHYTFEALNCQRFVKQNLEANGLLTPELNHFIMQNAQELLAKAPSMLKRLTQRASDAAAFVRKITGTGQQPFPRIDWK